MTERTLPSTPRSRTTLVLAIVAGVLVVAVVVVGVVLALRPGAEAPAVSESASPSVTATPTPFATPTPTPAPVPEADAADPTTWTITFTSIGPATLGSDRAATRTLFPSLTDDTNPLCIGDYTSLTMAGVNLLLLGGQTAPDSVAGLQASGDDFSVSPTTDAGIGLGSSLEQLQAAYPGIEISTTGSVSSQGSVTDGAGHWIAFALINDLIHNIQVASEADLPRGNGQASGIPRERCPA